MAKWMNALLARGKLPDGTRLFSDPTYREITTLVTPIPLPDLPPELAVLRANFNGYALVVRWRDRELRADAFITFALKPDGSIERAKMAAVSPATDFSFDFQDLLLTPVK